MERTIIGVYGRQSEGKSETIIRVRDILLRDFPNASIVASLDDGGQDILTVIQLGNVRIGLESQGDPNSRLIAERTVHRLANREPGNQFGNCDIIVCATRTGGMTVNEVSQVAVDFGYHGLWISSFFSPTLNSTTLNTLAAENLVAIIGALIIGRLAIP